MEADYEGSDDLVRAPVLEDYLGVSQGRIRQYVRDGMPRAKRGLYPIRTCIQWVIDYWRRKAEGALDISLEESKRRRAAADAELREIELARKRGDSIPSAEVAEMLEQIAVPFSNALDDLKSISPELANRPVQEVDGRLSEGIDRIRSALSKTTVLLADSVRLRPGAEPVRAPSP